MFTLEACEPLSSKPVTKFSEVPLISPSCLPTVVNPGSTALRVEHPDGSTPTAAATAMLWQQQIHPQPTARMSYVRNLWSIGERRAEGEGALENRQRDRPGKDLALDHAEGRRENHGLFFGAVIDKGLFAEGVREDRALFQVAHVEFVGGLDKVDLLVSRLVAILLVWRGQLTHGGRRIESIWGGARGDRKGR